MQKNRKRNKTLLEGFYNLWRLFGHSSYFPTLQNEQFSFSQAERLSVRWAKVCLGAFDSTRENFILLY